MTAGGIRLLFSVIEYETLKELEAIRKRMNKYGFHTDINGEFDEE